MNAQAEGATPDMALRLQQILKETPDKNLYLGTKDIRKLRAWLESPPFYAKAAEVIYLAIDFIECVLLSEHGRKRCSHRSFFA